jgi:hypothetical protein
VRQAIRVAEELLEIPATPEIQALTAIRELQEQPGIPVLLVIRAALLRLQCLTLQAHLVVLLVLLVMAVQAVMLARQAMPETPVLLETQAITAQAAMGVQAALLETQVRRVTLATPATMVLVVLVATAALKVAREVPEVLVRFQATQPQQVVLVDPALARVAHRVAAATLAITSSIKQLEAVEDRVGAHSLPVAAVLVLVLIQLIFHQTVVVAPEVRAALLTAVAVAVAQL